MTGIAPAQRRLADTERRALSDQPGRAKHFLDLGRADSVARGLHHLVATTDEVKNTLSGAARHITQGAAYAGS